MTSSPDPPPASGDASVQRLGATGYLAAEGYLEPLLEELGQPTAMHGRLVMQEGPQHPTAWAQNIWLEPHLIRFSSIKQGATALRAMGRNWAHYGFSAHRRATLIQKLLPHVSAKPLVFPALPPLAPLGSWTLLDETTMLASPLCSSPFRHGEANFVEDKQTPPNRAYLKLWEAFSIIRRRPSPGERCLDLGACPGGWTWVMQECGAQVIAVDKAPLDPAIAALPGVSFLGQSAFSLRPTDIGPVDWLCSDVICYPERLYRLVMQWLEHGLARRFVCTLKFQGATDHATARAFAAIPGARLMHLHHNKHELTWIKLADGEFD
jgi:23S rRNA (cytidine2498-2'-O)-methyltransferase